MSGFNLKIKTHRLGRFEGQSLRRGIRISFHGFSKKRREEESSSQSHFDLKGGGENNSNIGFVTSDQIALKILSYVSDAEGIDMVRKDGLCPVGNCF